MTLDTMPCHSARQLLAICPGLSKPISEAELALWDMSIGPDGMPPGGGTAARGASIYAQKCQACHGKEGQGGANSVLINAPHKSDRTTALYVPNAATIFDFTRRAMPWPQPKSLTNDQIYALTAYILAGNKIIGENETTVSDDLLFIRRSLEPYAAGL